MLAYATSSWWGTVHDLSLLPMDRAKSTQTSYIDPEWGRPVKEPSASWGHGGSTRPAPGTRRFCEALDGINVAWSGADGGWTNVVLSAASMIPVSAGRNPPSHRAHARGPEKFFCAYGGDSKAGYASWPGRSRVYGRLS